MRYRSFRTLWRVDFAAWTVACMAVLYAFALDMPASAQETNSAEATQNSEADQGIVENTLEDTQVPSKDDSRNRRQGRDEQTLLADATPSQTEQTRMELEKRMQELMAHQQELLQQRNKLEKQYSGTLTELKQVQNQFEEQRSDLQRQMEMTRAQLAEWAARQAQAQAVAASRQMTNVFSLRHSNAPDVANVIAQILGDKGLKVGVDDRSNSLVVSGGEDALKTVTVLLQKLDSAGDQTPDRPAQTLQLRMLWLLDIDEGMAPTEKLVSPEVIDGLRELGFSDPKVVCQQVTTLTLGGNDRSGSFHFAVPVLIRSQPWQFEGQGEIEPMADEKFNLQFNLQFQQLNMPNEGGGRGGGQKGQLGGSIYTPLKHYTVMGTTTFVSTSPLKADPATGAALTEQHLSAFVVYLDRAREYPAAGAQSQPQTDERR